MKRLHLTGLSILFLILLPLIFNPYKILSWEILYLILFVIAVNYSQPELRKGEAEENKGSDANSVKLIIVASMLSTIIPLLDWAYLSVPELLRVKILGVSLGIFGLVIRYIAIVTLGRYFTATVNIQVQHKLIRSGLYKYLRHPSYTGAYIAFISISLVFNSLIGLVSSFCIMSVAYYYRISREEKELEKHFHEDYSDYKKNTWKIIPFFW